VGSALGVWVAALLPLPHDHAGVFCGTGLFKPSQDRLVRLAGLGVRMRRGAVRRVLLLLVAAGTLALLPARPAGAINMNAVWPELGLPGFRITPFLAERLEYHANVLQQPRNELDDLISRTIPGVVVELPLGRHRVDLAARAEIVRYLTHQQFDTEHFYLLGRVALNFPGGLAVRFREELVKTSDPASTEVTGRINSTTNTLAPEVEYTLARRFSLGAAYTLTHVAFDDTITQLNRDEHTVGVTGFWKMTGRSDLLASLLYGLKTFDEASNRNSERIVGMVGLRGALTSRLSSTFRIGFEHRKSSLQTIDTITSSGDWVFAPTERTRFSLLTQRSVEESVFGTNTTYTATVATFLAQQRFSSKITANGRIFGGMNEYLKLELDRDRFHRRTDRFYGLGLGVDYQIQRWLAVGADYTASDRVSNFRDFSYTDHVVGLKITLSL
jgi:hypothetical protein